jgi:hypothetical protein
MPATNHQPTLSAAGTAPGRTASAPIAAARSHSFFDLSGAMRRILLVRPCVDSARTSPQARAKTPTAEAAANLTRSRRTLPQERRQRTCLEPLQVHGATSCILALILEYNCTSFKHFRLRPHLRIGKCIRRRRAGRASTRSRFTWPAKNLQWVTRRSASATTGRSSSYQTPSVCPTIAAPASCNSRAPKLYASPSSRTRAQLNSLTTQTPLDSERLVRFLRRRQNAIDSSSSFIAVTDASKSIPLRKRGTSITRPPGLLLKYSSSDFTAKSTSPRCREMRLIFSSAGS